VVLRVGASYGGGGKDRKRWWEKVRERAGILWGADEATENCVSE
jgi:hypothetical protein